MAIQETIKVKNMAPDEWNRPRLRNIATKAVYADINLGDPKYGPPAWHTTTEEGEPISPLKSNIVFELTSPGFGACCPKAVPMFCVCMHSYRCPEHRETHIGTHD